MITWMQRHKKYLIITVWISVIAFVAAGFIGWGAYDFNLNRSSSVAKVGDHTISKQAFQRAYNNYFNYFNNERFNGELTEELAREVGLDQFVLNILIDEAILLNFADELGITALDSDIIELITADENFQKNGSFNKDAYYSALQNSGYKPSSYEDTLKKQVLLNKLYGVIMNFPVDDIEKEILGAAMFMEDRLSVAAVTVNDNELKIDENEIKTYWEMSKGSFLTEKVYNFESIFVPLSKDKLSEEEIMASYDETKYFYRDDENRILEYAEVKKDVENALRVKNAEQDALRVYLSFKKGERTADKNITVKESSSEYDTSLFLAMSEGETLHPIQKENGWEVLKLISVIAPSPKSYEEARAQIIPILKANKRVELLAQRSLSNLNSFKGTDLGFVTRDESNITGLTTEQSRQFINTVFSSRDKRGYVILGDKAYLYNILEQRLPNGNKLAQNDADLENAIKQIRESEIRQKLISTLKPRYKIQQY